MRVVRLATPSRCRAAVARAVRAQAQPTTSTVTRPVSSQQEGAEDGDAQQEARMSQLESRLGGLEQALTDLSRQLAEAGLLGDVPHLTPPQTRRQEQREARRRVEEMGSRDGSVDKGTGNGGVVGEPPPAGGGRGGAAVDTGGGGTSSSGRGGGGGSGSGAASALPSSETMSGEKAAEASGITSLQPRIIGFINSGYLQAVKDLRHTLLLSEWEMTEKPAARRRGVGQFEQWCVENKVTVEYEALSALYRDPRDLSVLSDPQLRMMARAKVEQAVYDRWQKVYEDCTKRAQDMSALVMRGEKASLMDVLKGVLPWPFGSR